MQARVGPHGDNYSHSEEEMKLIRCIRGAGISTTLSFFIANAKAQ